MKNIDQWRPTKVRFNKKVKRFELNPGGIFGGSYHIASLQIQVYVPLLLKYISGRLLDCGCGKVPFYQVYKNQVSEIVCVDWDQMNPHLDYVVDLNEKLPFKDLEFDSILISDVIAHIKKPEILFSELVRVLKPSGKLVLFSPFLYWICEEPHDFQRLTEYSYRQYCQNYGMKIVELDAYGGRIDVLMDLLNKKFSSGMFRRILLLFSKIVLRASYFGNRRRATSTKFPIGYFLVAQKA